MRGQQHGCKSHNPAINTTAANPQTVSKHHQKQLYVSVVQQCRLHMFDAVALYQGYTTITCKLDSIPCTGTYMIACMLRASPLCATAFWPGSESALFSNQNAGQITIYHTVFCSCQAQSRSVFWTRTTSTQLDLIWQPYLAQFIICSNKSRP